MTVRLGWWTLSRGKSGVPREMNGETEKKRERGYIVRVLLINRHAEHARGR